MLATEIIFSTRINTVFARLGVLDKPCFLSKLNRRICLRPLVGQRQAAHFLSRAKNTDFFVFIQFCFIQRRDVVFLYNWAEMRVWSEKTGDRGQGAGDRKKDKLL